MPFIKYKGNCVPKSSKQIQFFFFSFLPPSRAKNIFFSPWHKTKTIIGYRTRMQISPPAFAFVYEVGSIHLWKNLRTISGWGRLLRMCLTILKMIIIPTRAQCSPTFGNDLRLWLSAAGNFSKR